MPRSVTVARLTVDRPAKYSRRGNGVVSIPKWLENHADFIEHYGEQVEDGWQARMLAIHSGMPSGMATLAKLKLNLASSLSPETRTRVVRWLRSRAKYLRKHAKIAMTSRRGWFVQEFTL